MSNNTSVVWLSGEGNYTPIPGGDPLLSNRDESWRWAMFTRQEAPLGDLDGVSNGTIELNVNSTIRGGGNLTWTGKPEDQPDWLQVRLQPWYVLKVPGGEVTWPISMFIPSAPRANHGDTGTTVSLEIYDKLLILQRDAVEKTYSLAAGVKVTTAIRSLIVSTGETLIAIEDSTETLTSSMVWEIGTTKLQIINELLDAINYFSLSCDGFGAFRAGPYKDAQTRPTVRTFTDDEDSIYSPDFSHEEDDFEVPNKVTLVGRSEGEVPALVSTAVNIDPANKYSQPNRGWIFHSETDIEATSQSVLNAMAARKLKDLQRVSSSFDVQTAIVPLDLNDVVAFENEPTETKVRAVVQTMSISTEVGALVRMTLREVV